MARSRTSYRAWVSCIAMIGASVGFAQEVDSLHVFKSDPPGVCTSASANAMIWRLHQQGAEHTTLLGTSLGTALEALNEYQPTRFTFGELNDLAYLVMAFSGGRPMAVGITEDLGRVINFTSRKEYRISTWVEHAKVRALIGKLLMSESLSVP